MSTKNCEFRKIRSGTNRNVLRCVHETHHIFCSVCAKLPVVRLFCAFLANRHTEGRIFIVAVNAGAVPCVCHELSAIMAVSAGAVPCVRHELSAIMAVSAGAVPCVCHELSASSSRQRCHRLRRLRRRVDITSHVTVPSQSDRVQQRGESSQPAVLLLFAGHLNSQHCAQCAPSVHLL
jgi:hypothetical protein